ncbi:uncharacterized protein LOC125242289 isoform X2 [Leguminivora glycinivorella]|uniref:uncharacterized protein LOC125242289 isoform X2 n=1 Tax=Leguminivora glycinivorella TaxID=1035111 RepID=UPI00200F4520|nr:uncharacterized protein LOC125242289 isoform X2 [Leguminivora glycinivorella]
MNAVIVLVLFASLTIVRGYDVDNPPIVCSNSSNCTYYQDKSSSDTFYYYVNGSQIQIKYVSMTEFSLRCTKNISLSSYDKFPVLKEPDDIKTVIFCNCNAPDKNTSYYDILKLWNITLTKTLFLNQQPAFTLHERHLRDLQIHELKIVAEDHETPLRSSKDFLSGVTELRFLELRNVILDVQAFMQFPVKLDNLKLIHAQVPAAVSKLRNGSTWLERLHSLNKLFIQERYIAAEPLTLPKLKSLQNLTSLILINVPQNSSSLKGALNGSSIKSLELQNCGLNMNNLSHNMFEGANLTSLVIKHHKLTVSRGVFSPLQWLTMLDLSANGIDGGTLVDAVSSLPHLHTLVANNNPLGSLCGDADVISAEPKWPNSLNRLELANTNATRICPGWVENDELMHIDLTDNNIGDLTYDDLIMKRAVKEPVVIKLSNNPNLGIIEISSTDNLQCHNDSAVENTNNRTRVKVAVIMETIKMRCDRGGYLLQKALLDCPLWLAHVGGKPDTERLCPYNDECLQECTCSKRPRDNATVVECRKELPPSPRWPPSSRQYPLVLYAAPGTLDTVPANITLLELHAPNNSISRLDVWDIADTLVELDVSYNKIRLISKDAALKLVDEGTNRSLKLEGNSLGCSCSDEVALELLGKSD